MKIQWCAIISACLLMTADSDVQEEANSKNTGPIDRQVAQQTDSNAKPVNRVDAITEELKKAAFEYDRIMVDGSKEEKAKIASMYPDPSRYADEVRKIAAETTDPDTAAAAYAFLAAYVSDLKHRDQYLDVLFEKYVDSPRMYLIAANVIYDKPNVQLETRLRGLVKYSPHHNVKGIASFALAKFLQRSQVNKRMILDDEGDVWRNHLGKDSVEYLKSFKSDRQQVVDLLRSVVDKYADVPFGFGPDVEKLGDVASAALFEFDRLQIDCIAPDIKGRDMDGVEFALSDYRGKVVMLDFWGDW